MKTSILARCGLLGTCAMLGIGAGAAHAQSNVTMYGLISAGVGYVSNQGGSKTWQALSGTNQNPRWGMRGSEDLGNGTKAIFTIEAGFSVVNGTAAQNGRAFGRQSYVGLSDKSLGTLTVGRQYDTVHDYVGPVIISSNGVNIGDNDNGYNDIRMQNSVKYVSPTYRGLQGTAQYGFSNSATGFRNNNAYSLGLGYTHSDFSWNVVYAQFNSPFSGTNPDGAIANDYASPLLLFSKSAVHTSVSASQQRIFGTGGFYTIGPAVIGALFTDVRFTYLDQTHLHLQNFDLTLNYHVTPALVLGAAYGFTNGKYDVIETRPQWHQVNLQADYFLSKRTDIALTLNAQQAAGDAKYAQLFGYSASSTKRQTAVTLGMRHVF
ncbi:porin [Pandoraea terrae]|uniref:Porin n=1 Tax=Pandoraea terrae TaxID=1537710 RepID=A0A5E4YDD3_9BURK|nr:porin [Pandoraea terrae]VVE46447.1 porin [Pandoraea terrae]